MLTVEKAESLPGIEKAESLPGATGISTTRRVDARLRRSCHRDGRENLSTIY